ncbi:MAG: hypothetical protein COV44_01625 [Deltaproteobacteria bacterium CG11_big_fil_rev_8_21_14_0_20_45_16]|nr:MAG: hypothetical protein COV44_01625 [Deltaproteobacteria bacterium CG11_big_fil_rev_8_21_14_0_20_45_16]
MQSINTSRKFIGLVSLIILTILSFSKIQAQDALPKEDEGIKLEIGHYYLPPTSLEFQFDNFQKFWIGDLESWQALWKDHNANPDSLPGLKVDFQKKAILALFWKSEEGVIRYPSILTVEEVTKSETEKNLRLRFNLTTPCFGLVTSRSPAMFLVFDREDLKYSKIEVESIQSNQQDCFGSPSTSNN